jgi:carboxyl-terminal processing protease
MTSLFNQQNFSSKLGLLGVLLSAWLLTACGGGGGGGTAPDAQSYEVSQPITSNTAINPAAANRCESPRPGSADSAGSLADEKTWVRSLMGKTYLWYKDIPQVNAGDFTAANYGNDNAKALNAYFQALKTPAITASGKRVDQFSFTLPTVQLVNQQSGISTGYGLRLAFISNTVPRNIRVLYVEEGSPAALAGVSRGDQIRSVDGVSVDDTTAFGINAFNNGLFPAVASKTTQLGLLAPGAAAARTLSVTSSQNIAITPVAQTKSFVVGTQTVGYLVLNSFGVNSAEQQLVAAVNQLKAANVQELVLDLRYNGGGFLDISNQLSWMIGSSSLAGQVYERTVCNDKNPFAVCNTADNFKQTTLGISAPAGQPLPQLGLKRVFVLTSASTCSASEAVINGLAPFLQVVRIGNTTCGKPYGFTYGSNCGTSYAAMQFKGANSLGFGDYADGFAPTCTVADDLSRQRGDASERMLFAALGYVQTGACPVASASSVSSTQKVQNALMQELGLSGNFQVNRSPLEEQRWYRALP